MLSRWLAWLVLLLLVKWLIMLVLRLVRWLFMRVFRRSLGIGMGRLKFGRGTVLSPCSFPKISDLTRLLHYSIVNPLWVRTPLIRNLTDAGDSFDQPIMDTGIVSGAVVKHILERKSGSIILPASSSVATFIRSFPSWLQEWLRSSFSLKVMKVRNEFWSREPSL